MNNHNAQPEDWKDEYPSYHSREGWEFEKALRAKQLKDGLNKTEEAVNSNPVKTALIVAGIIAMIFLPKIVQFIRMFFCILIIALIPMLSSGQQKPVVNTNIYVSSQGTSVRLTQADTAYLNHTTLSIRNSIMAVKGGGTIRNNEIADFIQLLLKHKKAK